MTIAIIVGILALAIAPLFWAMPTRRERQLAALRTAARTRGFSLQVTEVEHPDPTAEMQVSAGGKKRRPMQACVAYRLQRSPSGMHGSTQDAARAAAIDTDDHVRATELLASDSLEPNGRKMARTRLVRRAGAQSESLPSGWQLAAGFEPADTALREFAAHVASDVLAIESNRTSASVFWLERGGEQRLAELESMLRQLMQAQAAAAQPAPASRDLL